MRRRIGEVREEAERRVADAVRDAVDRHRESAQATVNEFNTVTEQYRERLEALSTEFEEEVGPLRERFEEQEAAFAAELARLDVDLPELPVGEPPYESDGWMFDSDRDFVDQTLEFQHRQKKR